MENPPLLLLALGHLLTRTGQVLVEDSTVGKGVPADSADAQPGMSEAKVCDIKCRDLSVRDMEIMRRAT